MRHHSVTRKFGREKKQRAALLMSLATSLIEREAITTTEAKAKELRPFVEKLVTRAKPGTIAARRVLVSRVGIAPAKKLVETLAPKYKERAGGYTRITKLPARKSDGAPLARIEFV
jgi:large subunit ribosomal protein L17